MTGAAGHERPARPRLLGLSLALVVAAGPLAGSGMASASSPPAVTLYSGQHQQTTDSLVVAFEKKTGVKVHVRYDDEASFADQIETEGSRSPADVFYTENTPPLEALQAKGLLSPLRASTLAHIPRRYDSPRGDWVGVTARVSVLIYNPRLIKKSQLPRTVLGIGDARYKGKLAVAPGETDFDSVVTSVARAYGQARALQWLRAVKADAGSHVYPDSETVVDEVNRGAVAFGVVNQYYWYRMRAEIGASNIHSAITYFAPRDPGYVLDVAGAAVLKSSKHQAQAQDLVAFLVSKPAQEIIVHSLSFEYPLLRGVSQPAETPLGALRPNGVTLADLGDGSGAIALMRKAGLL